MYKTLTDEPLKTFLYLKLGRDATKEEIERLSNHMEKWFERWPQVAHKLVDSDPAFKLERFDPLLIIKELEEAK